MKATIISIREGAHRDASRHTIVVAFGETKENVTGLAAIMQSGIIAGGVTTYEATFDLVRIANALPQEQRAQVLTNGVYDPVKGYALAQTLFAPNSVVDNPEFNLFVIPITEVSGGKCASVLVNVGDTPRVMTAYRRAGFFNRETCLQICKSAFAANVANGTFVPNEVQPAQPQINLSTLLGGANTVE